MPCFTSRTVSVQLEKYNDQIMLQALTDLALRPVLKGDVISFGNNEWINVKTGQSRLSTNRTTTEIRQAYSKALVQRTAKRFGWTVKTTGQNQLQIIKRN